MGGSVNGCLEIVDISIEANRRCNASIKYYVRVRNMFILKKLSAIKRYRWKKRITFAAAIILLLAINRNASIISLGPLAGGQSFIMNVPFDKNDPPYGIIPMGETVYHPKPKNPKGHSGIDFQWDHKAPVLAAADGVVVGIRKVPSSNTMDVGIQSGKYLNGYTELESYNPKLKVGTKVAAGAFIGYPWHPPGTKSGYRMFHWQFGYYTDNPLLPDRLCPLSYLDDESRSLIETVWANAEWEHKEEFQDICSGDYKGKDK